MCYIEMELYPAMGPQPPLCFCSGVGPLAAIIVDLVSFRIQMRQFFADLVYLALGELQKKHKSRQNQSHVSFKQW